MRLMFCVTSLVFIKKMPRRLYINDNLINNLNILYNGSLQRASLDWVN